MPHIRRLAAALAIAAAATIGVPQVGRAAPVAECTQLMSPTRGHGCTVDLTAGDHRIRVDMVSAVTGTYHLKVRDSVGVVFYEASCTQEPGSSECSSTSRYSAEADTHGGGGGSLSIVAVSKSSDYAAVTLSNGGTASLETGPGTGAVTLDVS